MHIILRNHVTEMAADFAYEGFDESKLFEFFCNYCVISKHFFGRFNPIDVTTIEDDASLDGIAIIIDGDLITTLDDAKAIFQTHKTNLSVDVVFTQAKSGEQFKKEEINNFKVGIEDFLTLDPQLPNGKFNKVLINIFKLVLQNLKKVRNRRPSVHIYYCTSGTYKEEREIKASFNIIQRYVVSTDFFFNVSVFPVGRNEVLKLYANLTEKNEAKLKLIDYFGMPEMPGIPQSYVGIVNAGSLVDSLLIDDDGGLKQSVFEENVRSFLGDTNDVNLAIQQTLENDEKKKLFSVLNNGITIVAPEMTLTPNTKELSLNNYQIINGCQTSSTLQANRDLLTDTVNVVVKFIQSPNNESSTDIISATNSQSDIPKESFYGLRDKAKLVQKYFEAQDKTSLAENKVFFERRQGEFRGAGLQSTRIFDVREVARCFAAMFLNQPHNSARYVKTIFSASGESLFKEDDHESYYYVSALALYKYQTLINGRKIGAQNFVKLRWHVIHLFKWFCHGKVDVPLPGARKAEAYANKIIEVLNSDTKQYIKVFERCQALIDELGIPTDDALKRSKFTQDLLSAATLKLAPKGAKA